MLQGLIAKLLTQDVALACPGKLERMHVYLRIGTFESRSWTLTGLKHQCRARFNSSIATMRWIYAGCNSRLSSPSSLLVIENTSILHKISFWISMTEV